MPYYDLFAQCSPVESDDSDESDDYNGEDILDSDNRVSLEKLKSMREKIGRDIKEEKAEFLEELYQLIGDWNGRLPNLRDIFPKKEIDWLLTKSVMFSNDQRDQAVRFVKFVARTGYKDEPDVDKDGQPILRRTTPVHHYKSELHYYWHELVKDLFKIYDRFDLNYIDAESGLSHFHVACMADHHKIVKKFLKLGQDPNVVWRETGDSPLHLAMKSHRPRVISLLLRNGADPNLANEDGSTPLHVICQEGLDVYLYGLFFEFTDHMNRTVRVDARDNSGRTPLHLALEHGLRDTAEGLILNGADPNLPNAEGSAPLHIVCKRKEKYRDENCELATMLIESCDEDDMPRLLIDAGDEAGGDTPLHLAVGSSKNLALLELLLIQGAADPNSANAQGSTPLHAVCKDSYCRLMAIRFFDTCDRINRPVLIDARDNLGRTPLQWAVASLAVDTVDVLLDRGADLASFVFPAEGHFAECFEAWRDENEFKLKLGSGLMTCVERLEKRGFQLDRSDALAIMRLFARYGLFQASADLERPWYNDESFAMRMKQEPVLVTRKFLHHVVLFSPEEAAKSLSYTDYFDFARSKKIRPYRHREAIAVHLCEQLSRGFFRSWALDPFWKLIHCRLPLECCEMVLLHPMNEDLYNICLAAADQKD